MTWIPYSTIERYRMTNLIEQVENGELTDITPYLENEEFLKALAKKGLLYDQYMDTKYVDVLITLITNGYAKEYYHMLAYHEDVDIRYTLAQNGYELDILSQDDDSDILTLVLIADDSYIPEYLNRNYTPNTEWYAVRDYLYQKRNPNINYLKMFLDTPSSVDDYDDIENVLSYKYEAMTLQTSTIEKTMNFEQIYAIGGARWAKELTASEIRLVWNIEKEYPDVPHENLAPYIAKQLKCTTYMEQRKNREKMRKELKREDSKR